MEPVLVDQVVSGRLGGEVGAAEDEGATGLLSQVEQLGRPGSGPRVTAGDSARADWSGPVGGCEPVPDADADTLAAQFPGLTRPVEPP